MPTQNSGDQQINLSSATPISAPATAFYELLRDEFLGTSKWSMLVFPTHVEFSRSDGGARFEIPASMFAQSIEIGTPPNYICGKKRNVRVTDQSSARYEYRATPKDEIALHAWLHKHKLKYSRTQGELADKERAEKRHSTASYAWSHLLSGFGATAISNLCLAGGWLIPAGLFFFLGTFFYLSAPIYTIIDFTWFYKTKQRIFLVHGICGVIANAVVWPLMVIVNIYMLKKTGMHF